MFVYVIACLTVVGKISHWYLSTTQYNYIFSSWKNTVFKCHCKWHLWLCTSFINVEVKMPTGLCVLDCKKSFNIAHSQLHFSDKYIIKINFEVYYHILVCLSKKLFFHKFVTPNYSSYREDCGGLECHGSDNVAGTGWYNLLCGKEFKIDLQKEIIIIIHTIYSIASIVLTVFCKSMLASKLEL